MLFTKIGLVYSKLQNGTNLTNFILNAESEMMSNFIPDQTNQKNFSPSLKLERLVKNEPQI